MQIALYLKHFPANGPVNDGASLAVAGLAAGLAENGARVTVLCEGAARQSARGPGYDVECFAARRGGRSFAMAPELKRFVADRAVPGEDLCVLNGMFHPAVYAMGRWLDRL